MLVFDVGANVGTKAAEMRAKGARVVCFEPQPECVARLEERFVGDREVQIAKMALGSKAGEAELFVCEDANQISTLSTVWMGGRFKDYRWSSSLKTPIDTLDAMMRKFGVPDYCKIDVEGFELDVLAGLSSPLPLLSFEFCKEFMIETAACLERLESIGFSLFNVSYGETNRFKSSRWLGRETLLAELEANRHPLAWGDVFAAPVPPDPSLIAVLPGDYARAASDDLDRLMISGLAYPGVSLRLHLGCGEKILDGYINIDYPASKHNVMRVNPDFEGDVIRLEFPDESVDEIRLHHVFEHFNRVVALGLLIRWHGWLRKGGAIQIETPDFLASAESALQHSGAKRLALVRHLEGDQAADWAYHVGQWYPERFERTLTALGYSNVTTEKTSTAGWHEPPLHNVIAFAKKVASVPVDDQLAAADECLWESAVHELERPTWEVWRSQLREFLGQGQSADGPIAHAPLSNGRP